MEVVQDRAAAAELRRRAAAAGRRRRRARAASARAVAPGASWPRTAVRPAQGSGSPTPRRWPSEAAFPQPAGDDAPRTVAAPPRTADKAKRDLLIGTSMEHDSAVGMRTRGNPCRQARLADSRLAGQAPHRPHGRAKRAPRACETRRSAAARPTNGRDSSRASTGGSGTGRCDDCEARELDAPPRRRLPGSAPRSDRASATRSRSCRARTVVSSPSRCETRALIALVELPVSRRAHAARTCTVACAFDRRGYHVVAGYASW